MLTKIFTQNDRFDSSLSVLSVNVPKNNQPYFNLQNAGLELKLANTDLTKANVDFKLNVDSVKQTLPMKRVNGKLKAVKLIFS